jgi:hypothetical protein
MYVKKCSKMSIREKPVASRHLDVREKGYSYQKHVHAVATSRSTINTQRPDVPPRLRVWAVTNGRHRQHLLRTYDEHNELISEAVRPQSSARPARQRLPANSINVFRYDPVVTPRNQPQANLPRWPIPNSFAPEPQAHKHVSVKIGYQSDPIIETETETESQYD